jgi:hypothetical protein
MYIPDTLAGPHEYKYNNKYQYIYIYIYIHIRSSRVYAEKSK